MRFRYPFIKMPRMPSGKLAGVAIDVAHHFASLRAPALAIAAALAGCVSPLAERGGEPRIAVGGDSPIVSMIDRVAAESGVPAALLATMAYLGSRFEIAGDAHTHGRGAVGIFGLDPASVDRGASLAGVDAHAARTELLAGLRAGAALLREAAPGAHTIPALVATLEPNLRRAVVRSLERGVDARDVDGKSIVIAAQPLDPIASAELRAEQAPGYPAAEWVPAYSGNYGQGDRGVGDITNIVIHTTQGGFNGTLSWFQDPDANVSAHYVVRSSDGYIAQMVDESDVAWHDRCFNTKTVGIEHEGFVDKPELWYTEPLYIESAKLTAYLADKYGIPKEMGAIVGHDTAPDCSDHNDPGPGWDWDHYLDLVKTYGAPLFAAEEVVVEGPPTLVSGERATFTVTLTNRGNTAWEPDLTRLGTALPTDRESELFVDGDWVSPARVTGIDARAVPGATGTFTFDVIAPDVREPTVIDEGFQLVEEDLMWFGPEIHVVFQTMPAPDSGGCSSSGGGSLLFGLGLVGLVLRRRRR